MKQSYPQWRKIIVIPAISLLGVAAIAFMSLFVYQAINKEHYDYPSITFDAEGGTLELYDTDKVSFPITKGEDSWEVFYPKHNYIGATKDGYDFLCWSIDGKNPIPDDYIIDKPVTLKPLYVKNRDCITISCRFFDESNPDFENIYMISDNYSYSYNGETFKHCDQDTSFENFATGDYISFKKEVRGEQETTGKFIMINSDSKTRFAVSGSIDVLTHKEDFYDNEFASCFSSCGGLCSARGLDLSGHDLTNGCFEGIFSSCSNLLFAPELPATALKENCYNSMFSGCYLLIQPPSIIPGEYLPDYSCQAMFSDCSELTHTPDLSKIKKLGLNSCEFMFQRCISLTSVMNFDPEVVSRLACDTMFGDCVSLVHGPKVLSANKHFEEEGSELVIRDGLELECYKTMFENCKSLIVAPEIKATILRPLTGYAPLQGMFSGCSKLSSIKIHYTGDFNNDMFGDWVDGVASEGTFYYNGSDTTTGTSAIPTGWEVKKF